MSLSFHFITDSHLAFPVADFRIETPEIYKVSGLNVLARTDEEDENTPHGRESLRD